MTENAHQVQTEHVTSVESEESRKTTVTVQFKPLRIWVPLLFILGILATRFAPRMIDSGSVAMMFAGILGPVVFSLLIFLWWIFASRASLKERLVGGMGVVVIAIVSMLLCHDTMRGPGMMLITAPMGFGLFGLTAVALSKMLTFKRTIIALLVSIAGFSFSTLLRNEGMWGNYELGIQWRWTPTSEEKLLAEKNNHQKKKKSNAFDADIDQHLANPQWSGFRGNLRDGKQIGITLSTDWSRNKIKPLWKITVGPGWSSFAVAGNLLFTQEQRGKMETVICYNAKTGDEIWTQQVKSRFDDPLGGPGPRATPTIGHSKLFVLGANGHLLCLDPKNGEIIWQKDIQKIADRKPPDWGFSSSPLIVNSTVIIHAGGKGDKGVLAFQTATGKLQWSSPAGDHSYSSPQLIRIAGEQVIAMVTNKELSLLNPGDGKVLLSYQCKSPGYRALQPQVSEDDSIFIGTGMDQGTEKVQITKREGKWSAKQAWVSKQLKQDFNDFVIVEGHAYGFDIGIFTCIRLKDGQRTWKKGRYNKGQVLLLEESKQLLVISEKGEIVLLKADPKAHQELAKFQAIKGKTWNHPVLIGNQLFVRNSKEAASFQLPVAE